MGPRAWALLLGIWLALSGSGALADDIRIGVLAKRGAEVTLDRWQGMADYLGTVIPEHRFSVVPLGFDDIGAAAAGGLVDLVLANSSFYVQLEHDLGAQRIATLRTCDCDRFPGRFGGVIFTRADRPDLNGLADAAGQRFMAVDPASLGGYHAAWRAFSDHGIDIHEDMAEVIFAGTHDGVVEAVLGGVADIGTVRSDTLETMAAEGRIDLADIKVLGARKPQGFPYLVSTPLYPEWPMAHLPHVPVDLSEQVAMALIAMPPEISNPAGYRGWTIPANYQPVRDLLAALHLPPYRDLGRIDMAGLWRQHWPTVSAVAAALVILAGATVLLMRLNRQLRTSRGDLLAAQEMLEERVRDRTAALSREAAERERAQAELARMVARLQDSNARLERYAFAAAHDLQEPVRQVVAFVQLLERRCAGDLDPAAAEYIAFAVDGAMRMSALVRGLLAYSRIGAGGDFRPVDLNRVLARALDILRPAIVARNADIAHDRLPTVRGDGEQLLEVFTALLDNALKFQPPDQRPVIRVDAEAAGDAWTVRVWDNGIGIAPAHAERIFNLFERLHTRDEYPGEGIGLALIKRIVDVHDGTVAVESTRDAGAVFSVTLPAADAKTPATRQSAAGANGSGGGT